MRDTGPGQVLSLASWIWSHPANRGHRLRALSRATAFQLRGRIFGRPSLTAIGNLTMEVPLHAWGISKVLYANPPDWPEMLAWKAHLQAGDLFVDVGANAGTYTLWAAGLGARVLAVEPATLALSRLRRNISLNPGVDVEVVDAAATDMEGEVSFDPSGDTTAHLGGPMRVRATTLDALVGDRSVAGVKIDVEGFERLVLQGAQGALAEQRIRLIQIEWNHCSLDALNESREPVAQLLRTSGYGLFRPDMCGHLLPAADTGFGEDIFAAPFGP